MTDNDGTVNDHDVIARRVLWSLPTGLYVLGSTGDLEDGPWNLMTINLVTQVATSPRVVAVSVEQGSRTASLIEATGRMALSILDREDRALVRRFVRPVDEIERDESGKPVAMSGVAVHLGANGAPILDAALGWIEMEVIDRRDFDSHRLLFGKVGVVGAKEALLDGPASARSAAVLRMEDTKMNYGG